MVETAHSTLYKFDELLPAFVPGRFHRMLAMTCSVDLAQVCAVVCLILGVSQYAAPLG